MACATDTLTMFPFFIAKMIFSPAFFDFIVLLKLRDIVLVTFPLLNFFSVKYGKFVYSPSA